MKKIILLPLAFAMTLFSLSCLETLISQIESVIEEDRLSVLSGPPMVTGTSVTITAITPSGILFGSEKNPSEYTYTMYYVKASDAYPTVASTEIADFLPLTGEELKTAAIDSGSSVQLPSDPLNPSVGALITFNIPAPAAVALDPDTLYLYVIETFHPSNDSSYTSISEDNRGWFKTGS